MVVGVVSCGRTGALFFVVMVLILKQVNPRQDEQDEILHAVFLSRLGLGSGPTSYSKPTSSNKAMPAMQRFR